MRILLAGLSLLVLPLAPVQGEIPSTKESFDCDVPGGRYDQYKRLIVANKISMAATVTVNQIRSDPTWDPVANVLLNLPNSKGGVGARFLVNTRSKLVGIFLRFPGQKNEFSLPVGNVKMKTVIPIQIEIDESRSTVAIGTSRHEGPGHGGAEISLSLSCSSIDAHIHDISIAAE